MVRGPARVKVARVVVWRAKSDIVNNRNRVQFEHAGGCSVTMEMPMQHDISHACKWLTTGGPGWRILIFKQIRAATAPKRAGPLPVTSQRGKKNAPVAAPTTPEPKKMADVRWKRM